MFVKVEGNSLISEKRIVDEARNCGISFGASCRAVRSEKVKNALLQAIPELQWVGVNTAGCVAIIHITEKTNAEQPDTLQPKVGNIVAARDGIIWNCTVTKGNALCQVGQAVRSGQILISGYADCGLAIKATRAEGEILAQTWRKLDVLSLTGFAKKQNSSGEKTTYTLILGKKLINLCKDSGISDVSCVKISSENYLTLPGGYQLPFGILKETILYYDYVDVSLTQETSFDWMQSSAESYLQSCMVGGQILNQNISIQIEDGICHFQGEYDCLEMIGQFKEEKFLQG